jgi:hypothetical protein
MGNERDRDRADRKPVATLAVESAVLIPIAGGAPDAVTADREATTTAAGSPVQHHQRSWPRAVAHGPQDVGG